MSGRPPWGVLAQTGVDLLISSLRLRVVSFTRLVSLLTRDSSHPAIAIEEARQLRRAMAAWNRRLPWRTECFEQGLAAYRYLARKGYQATLHYGARGSDGDVEAHVWVTSGDVPVVGCENASEFRELARYPAE